MVDSPGTPEDDELDEPRSVGRRVRDLVAHVLYPVEVVGARFMAARLRSWGPRCEVLDLDDQPADWPTGLNSRCPVCVAHEAADRLDALY